MTVMGPYGNLCVENINKWFKGIQGFTNCEQGLTIFNKSLDNFQKIFVEK